MSDKAQETQLKITRLTGREILDSRGFPTLEVDVQLDSGAVGRAAAPSGGSIGGREPVEMRDRDLARYTGRGVRQAIACLKTVIEPLLLGMPADRESIDGCLVALDGTENRSRLGANTMLAVSMAVTRALVGSGDLYAHLALHDWFSLPVPLFNVLNGGAHAANEVDFQEFMLAPVGAASFSQALQMGVETYSALRSLLRQVGKTTAVGDEGGFAADLDARTEAPDLLLTAIEHAGFKIGTEIVLAVDVAASELLENGTYVFRKSLRRRRTSEQMIQFYEYWLKHYPIWSIEDGLADEDTQGWQAMTAALGNRVQLVGDDLFVTNVARLHEGVTQGLANAILIKLNQVGTVSETLATIREAQRVNYGTIVSHRAGETADDFIADLAVAANAGQIKAGAPVRGERVAKYNQLLRIEEALGERGRYCGQEYLRRGGFRVAPNAGSANAA